MEMEQVTKIVIAYELLTQEVPKSHIANHLGISRRTVIRWAQAIEKHGSLEAFLEYYQQAKKGPRKKRKTDAILKRRIWALREKHHGCCGQKIQYFLEKDYGTQVSVTTIYKVLAEKYELRSKWKKNQKRGPVPSAQAPREVIQMDSVLFGDVFAFTAIDIYSKESDVLLRPSLEATDGQAFLQACMPRRFDSFAQIIQTDGGSELKKSSEIRFPITVSAIELHGLTRKMSKHLLKASIVLSVRNVWDGQSIPPRRFHN
jgi:transposase